MRLCMKYPIGEMVSSDLLAYALFSQDLSITDQVEKLLLKPRSARKILSEKLFSVDNSEAATRAFNDSDTFR